MDKEKKTLKKYLNITNQLENEKEKFLYLSPSKWTELIATKNLHEETVKLLICDGGFFWGHQFQEESMKEYKKIDLKFCKDALKWIKEGKEVWYDCWW